MSEPVTRRQPLIDLDEFERRMRRPDSPHVSDEAAIVELMRLIGAPDEKAAETEDGRQAVGFEPEHETDASATAFEPADANSQEPVIGGDFAEIEAALLRAARQTDRLPEPVAAPEPAAAVELRALRDEEDTPDDYVESHFSAIAEEFLGVPQSLPAALSATRDETVLESAGAELDRFVYVDDAAVSGEAALADEEKRSRRPLYLMAAVVFAGVAGIGASFSFRHDGASEASQAASKTPVAQSEETTPAAKPNATASAEAASPAPAPQQQASASAEDAASAAPAHEPSPRVISLSEAVNPANAAPPQAPASATPDILAPPPLMGGAAVGQALASPPAPLAPEAKKVKTAAVRPDGSLIKKDAALIGAPPAPQETQPQEAVAQPATTPSSPAQPAVGKPAHGKPALAKDGSPKTAVKTAALPPPRPSVIGKTAAKAPHAGAPKTAAVESEGHAKALASHNGVKTKAANPAGVAETSAPASLPEPQLAQAAPAAEPPPQKPSPAATGPLALVDTAVSSITGATNNILNWGRTATGARN
ncbi:hypothetical protein [Methylocella tundrae]|uniref:hypothetical protein n=1 Tax=Methylocella tundrae TaxID=227605 RepID=UPI0030FE2982|nr:hypothetical protein SIN04_13810 [Methylocella tundrae]